MDNCATDYVAADAADMTVTSGRRQRHRREY